MRVTSGLNSELKGWHTQFRWQLRTGDCDARLTDHQWRGSRQSQLDEAEHYDF